MPVPAAPAPHDNPFLGPLLARWHQHPDALFGMFFDGEAEEWSRVDVGEFVRRSLQFSALFHHAGAVPGDIVQIVLQHGLDAHAAFIGAMLCGGVPSFLPHPNSKQSEETYWRHHRSIFGHTRPRIILVYDELTQAVQQASDGTGSAVLRLSLVENHAPAAPAPPDADSVALLQHSSGTTGLKKGVALSYRAIAQQLQACAAALDLDAVPEARIVSWLPLYHDMGLLFELPAAGHGRHSAHHHGSVRLGVAACAVSRRDRAVSRHPCLAAELRVHASGTHRPRHPDLGPWIAGRADQLLRAVQAGGF